MPLIICILVFLLTRILIRLGKNTRSRIARSFGKCIFNFIRNSQTASQSGCVILHPPPTAHKSSSCFSSLSTFGSFGLFNFSHSGKCALLPHCSFNLCFLMTDDVEYFLMTNDVGHLYLFSVKGLDHL